MYLCLGRVTPVTLAVGNTVKRVVIIVATSIALRTPGNLEGPGDIPHTLFFTGCPL